MYLHWNCYCYYYFLYWSFSCCSQYFHHKTYRSFIALYIHFKTAAILRPAFPYWTVGKNGHFVTSFSFVVEQLVRMMAQWMARGTSPANQVMGWWSNQAVHPVVESTVPSWWVRTSHDQRFAIEKVFTQYGMCDHSWNQSLSWRIPCKSCATFAQKRLHPFSMKWLEFIEFFLLVLSLWCKNGKCSLHNLILQFIYLSI